MRKKPNTCSKETVKVCTGSGSKNETTEIGSFKHKTQEYKILGTRI